MVIAPVARSLPPGEQKPTIFRGIGAAIILRIILTVFAVALLTLPWLKIVGGLLLIWIGVQLLVPDEGDENIASSDNLVTAIRTILVADLVMSLDNVIAVAAAADSAPGDAKLVLLILGLGISIPIVIFGSTLVLHLMERFPVIITFGGALLGWIAGEMMVTDPVIADWVQGQAAWLHSYFGAAIVGAAAVVAIGTAITKRRSSGESGVQ